MGWLLRPKPAADVAARRRDDARQIEEATRRREDQIRLQAQEQKLREEAQRHRESEEELRLRLSKEGQNKEMIEKAVRFKEEQTRGQEREKRAAIRAVRDEAAAIVDFEATVVAAQRAEAAAEAVMASTKKAATAMADATEISRAAREVAAASKDGLDASERLRVQKVRQEAVAVAQRKLTAAGALSDERTAEEAARRTAARQAADELERTKVAFEAAKVECQVANSAAASAYDLKIEAARLEEQAKDEYRKAKTRLEEATAARAQTDALVYAAWKPERDLCESAGELSARSEAALARSNLLARSSVEAHEVAKRRLETMREVDKRVEDAAKAELEHELLRRSLAFTVEDVGLALAIRHEPADGSSTICLDGAEVVVPLVDATMGDLIRRLYPPPTPPAQPPPNAHDHVKAAYKRDLAAYQHAMAAHTAAANEPKIVKGIVKAVEETLE